MKNKFLLPFLSLLFIFACSSEEEADPVTPEPEIEEPAPPDDEDTEPPSKPEDLAVSDIGFTSISIFWKASTDNDKVDKYELFLDRTFDAEIDGTSATVSGLTPGRTYSFSVFAIDPSGNVSEESERLQQATLEDTEDPSIPGGLTATEITSSSFLLSWQESTDNAGIFEYQVFLNNDQYTSTTATEISLEELDPATSYLVSVLALDIYENNSELSPELEVVTENDPDETSPSLLFFSEYIEGSSFNKALEIVNLTGGETDLSAYSLKKISNQNEEWTDERKLEGVLVNEDVFVIAHSSAMEAILEQADFTLGGGVMDFNGNDVVGLFLDGELIDVIGRPGGTDFAKDVTLRRKTSIGKANPSYDPQEWEVLEKDSVDGLGTY